MPGGRTRRPRSLLDDRHLPMPRRARKASREAQPFLTASRSGQAGNLNFGSKLCVATPARTFAALNLGTLVAESERSPTGGQYAQNLHFSGAADGGCGV